MTQIASLPCLVATAGVEVDEDWSMSIGLFEFDGATPVSLAGLTLTASLTPVGGGDAIYDSAADIVVSGVGSNVLTLTVLAAAKAAWPPGLYRLEILATDGTYSCELVDRSKSRLRVGVPRFIRVTCMGNPSGYVAVNLPLAATPAGIAAAIATLSAAQLETLAAALNGAGFASALSSLTPSQLQALAAALLEMLPDLSISGGAPPASGTPYWNDSGFLVKAQ